MLNKKLFIYFGIILLFIIVVAYYFTVGIPLNNYQLYKGGKIYTRVDGFNSGEGGYGCLAETPECGYCPGVVAHKQCYEDTNERSDIDIQ